MAYISSPSHVPYHRVDRIAAYRVVQTYSGGERIDPQLEVKRIEGGEHYLEALDLARVGRTISNERIFSWAVVRPEYECGCVGGPF